MENTDLSQKLKRYFQNTKLFSEITEDQYNTQQHFIKEVLKLEEEIKVLEKKNADLNWNIPLPDFPREGH